MLIIINNNYYYLCAIHLSRFLNDSNVEENMKRPNGIWKQSIGY